MNEKISICLPAYNAEATISETIKSLLAQSVKDFELVIVDNSSTDNTIDRINSFNDPRIRLYRNKENLGCGKNLNVCRKHATGDILFFMSADDIACPDALKKVILAFNLSNDIGLVARPYYWFISDPAKPVRITKQFKRLEIVSIDGPQDKIADVLTLSGQISGMAFRKKDMRIDFRQEPFIETAALVADMLKQYKAAILKENIIAVRISDNGSMKPFVYQISPMMRWYKLVNETFFEDRFKGLKTYLVNHFIANNFIGLVQIKNFGTFGQLLREIYLLVKMKWLNIFNPLFLKYQ